MKSLDSAKVRALVAAITLGTITFSSSLASAYERHSSVSAELSGPRTSPYFPPFTHFVIIVRDGHTFDDYLGDCAMTVHAGCKGKVMSPNHLSSVPDLHKLAKTYAFDDSYSTGTQPPSGPNHWWLFSGQSASNSQRQSYPSAHGTVFDRFLHGDTVPAQGTNACSTQTTNSGSGGSPYTFVVSGDIYSMLNAGSGYWKNPTDARAEVLPIDRPGTTIPEELNYNQYACQGRRVADSQVASGFLSFVKTYGLPAYSYVGLFNDHPGSAQNIPENDAETYDIVNSIMQNAKYKNNTLIIVTEDDTQNGSSGPDHVSNTYRVPLVVIGSATYVKQHYLSHVAYTTSNVLAAMERVMNNVKPGILNPNGALGLSTFPMTSADKSALGDPLEDFWVRRAMSLSVRASASTPTGLVPLTSTFVATATGGVAPYTYLWNFGDGSVTSSARSASHTYTRAGTYVVSLAVRDSAGPANSVTKTVTITARGTVPGAPTYVIGTAGDASVTLTWRAPSSDGGEAVNAYEVFRGKSSGTETRLTSGGCGNPGAELTCTDTGLANGTTYYYYVVAANPIGTGPHSNEDSATPNGTAGGAG